MNREDLLLTEGEMQKAIRDANTGCLVPPPKAFIDALLQAQLDKVLKPEWKDKPDSIGWWWFYPDSGDMENFFDCYFVETIRGGSFWIKDATCCWVEKGKWIKAIVPELKLRP